MLFMQHDMTNGHTHTHSRKYSHKHILQWMRDMLCIQRRVARNGLERGGGRGMSFFWYVFLSLTENPVYFVVQPLEGEEGRMGGYDASILAPPSTVATVLHIFTVYGQRYTYIQVTNRLY